MEKLWKIKKFVKYHKTTENSWFWLLIKYLGTSFVSIRCLQKVFNTYWLFYSFFYDGKIDAQEVVDAQEVIPR